MINAAIVGLGRWGQNLVNSIQGRSDKIRIVAGATRTAAKAADYAKRQGFALYDAYEKVLADPSIDAIVIATPHTQRVTLITAAAAAGKHVFTEKPSSLTLRDALTCVNTCADHNVTLAVGYNWRFQPALQEVRRMLDDGRLGKLLHIEGNFCGPSVYRFGADHWRLNREEGPAGGMTGRGVHVVDAMLYLSGRIDTVFAQSHRRALDYGTDDTTSMLFRFRNGATGYLGTFIATAETWRMQVFGSRGWAEVGDVEHLTTWGMRACFATRRTSVHRRPHHRLCATEHRACRSKISPMRSKPDACSGRRGRKCTAAVLEAILESAAKDAPVKIDQ